MGIDRPTLGTVTITETQAKLDFVLTGSDSGLTINEDKDHIANIADFTQAEQDGLTLFLNALKAKAQADQVVRGVVFNE